MSSKPRGRPPKKRRNLAHLQKGSSSSTVPSSSQGCQPVGDGVDESIDVPIGRSRGTGQLLVHHKKDEASSEAEDSGEESDAEDYAESSWDELGDVDFGKRLAEMALKDDPKDFDWVPAKLRGQQTANKMGKLEF